MVRVRSCERRLLVDLAVEIVVRLVVEGKRRDHAQRRKVGRVPRLRRPRRRRPVGGGRHARVASRAKLRVAPPAHDFAFVVGAAAPLGAPGGAPPRQSEEAVVALELPWVEQDCIRAELPYQPEVTCVDVGQLVAVEVDESSVGRLAGQRRQVAHASVAQRRPVD